MGLLLAMACRGEGDAPAGPAETPQGPPIQRAQLQDPGINPLDTWVAFDAELSSSSTVSFATPIVDPASGQQVTELTLPAPPDLSFRVEAGYDSQARVRTSIVGLWSPALDSTRERMPDAYRLILTNGQLEEYSAGGMPLALPFNPADTAPVADGVLGLFGSDLLYGDITAGVLVDSLGALPSPGSEVRAYQTPGQIRLVSGRAGPGGGSVVERRYRRSGNRWIINEIVSRDSFDDGRTRHRRESLLRLTGVEWSANPHRDSLRAQARDSVRRYGLARPATRPMPAKCTDCVPPPPPPPPPPPAAPPRNIVFQHGFLSGSDAWTRMRDWLRPTYRFGVEVAPQLSSQARAQTQVGQLITQLAATGKDKFLVVGHSMGGLVGRKAAQQRPDLINGVVTVGTPHLGAPLALNTRSAISNALQALALELRGGGCPVVADAPCFLADILVYYGSTALVQYAADNSAPGYLDLLPVGQAANPFLTALNAFPESFQRVGILNYAAKRWVVMRQLGEFFTDCNPEDWCGGRNWVRWTSRLYNALRVCQVISALFGNPYYYTRCTTWAEGMNDLDAWWDRMTAPGDQTDGIVPGLSQAYPRATRNYIIANGDSHSGAPRSNLVRNQLMASFDQVFLVPRN